MDFTLNLPLNGVSFGQVSVALLREFYKKELSPLILPIGGNVDLATQEIDDDFRMWIESRINEGLRKHSRNTPTFKLWHINGSLESYSNNQVLLSFYELDQPTEVELNIVKNNSKVLFTSQQTVDCFKNYGIENVDLLNLGFDKYNFKKIDKKYFSDDRIVFNMVGKFEKRKHHQKVISSWAKRFGNNNKYFLQGAIYNNFISQEDNQKIVNTILSGQKLFNINFYGFLPKNKLYNDFLNSGDVVLSMSGGEGWGLPEFHSVALGKHCVALNASGYKQWANEENSVLVQPSQKIPVYDGMFFHEGQPYNQGNIYDFKEDEFINACEEVIKRVEENRLNEAGLKLQSEFTYENTANQIIQHLESL